MMIFVIKYCCGVVSLNVTEYYNIILPDYDVVSTLTLMLSIRLILWFSKKLAVGSSSYFGTNPIMFGLVFYFAC